MLELVLGGRRGSGCGVGRCHVRGGVVMMDHRGSMVVQLVVVTCAQRMIVAEGIRRVTHAVHPNVHHHHLCVREENNRFIPPLQTYHYQRNLKLQLYI